MRTSARVVVTVVGLACAAGAEKANAQQRKLYIWPRPDAGSPAAAFDGAAVAAASIGGGTSPSGQFGVVVTTNGDLTGFGASRWGQLGSIPPGGYRAPCDDHPEWCKLPLVGPAPGYRPIIYELSSGWDHTLGLSSDPYLASKHGLIGWGYNDPANGQACDIPNLWNAALPADEPWGIDPTARITKISAGEYINIVLFGNGQIAAWGIRDKGVDPRPHTPNTAHPNWNAFLPDRDWRFKDVAAGGHFVT